MVVRSAWVAALAIGLCVPAGARADEPDPNDHARVAGGVGVGWFGVSEIPLGTFDAAIAAPAIGARWWIGERFGVDLGLGLNISNRDTNTAENGEVIVADNGPKATAFLLHVGAPIALYAGRHYTLLAVPELNVGVASSSETTDRADDAAPAATTDRTGARVDAGGRVGAEIHFGFIGIPELALEASIGLFFSYRTAAIEGGGTSRETSAIELTTASFNDPWDFFRSAVAARYYF